MISDTQNSVLGEMSQDETLARQKTQRGKSEGVYRILRERKHTDA